MHHVWWVTLLAIALPSAANDSTAVSGGFYERKAEGWFWYQERPEKAEEQAVEETGTLPSTTPGIPALSAAWMRENLPKYKDAAWNNPTIENLQAFMYLQRYAMDRSQAFAESAEMAVLGDWFLDETVRRPEASFASQQLDKHAGAARQELVKKLAERVGLFFFFKSGCQHSQLQAATLAMLKQGADFTIVPISMNGGPLGSNIFPDYKIDSGHAAKLGVRSAPALFLVSENGEFSSIGYGVMSLQELERRLLVAAKRKSWVTPQEFDATRPVMNASSSKPQQSSPNLDPLPIPPSELVNHFRRISK